MNTCPKCGEPVKPGPRGMVWGYMYDVESNRYWIEGSDRGAFFHQDCWEKVKATSPDSSSSES